MIAFILLMIAVTIGFILTVLYLAGVSLVGIIEIFNSRK